MNLTAIYSSLWIRLSQRRKRQFKLIIALMVAASFLELISIGAIVPFLAVISNPEIIKDKFDYFNFFIEINNPKNSIGIISIIFCLLVAVSACTRAALMKVSTEYSYGVASDIGASIYDILMFQPYELHIGSNSSEWIDGISTKINVVSGCILMPFMTAISSIIILTVVLMGLIIINPLITLGCFILVISSYYLISRITNKKINVNNIIIDESTKKIMKILQESFGGIKDIIISNSYTKYINYFTKIDANYRKAQGETIFYAAMPRYIVEPIGVLALVLYTYIYVSEYNNLEMLVPTIGLMAMGSQKMLPLVQQLYSSITTIKSAQKSMGSLSNLFKLEENIEKKHHIDVHTFTNKIELKDVSFSYLNRQIKIIKNLNFVIYKGEKVGVKGKTGAGKSTFIDLFMGMLRPTSGEIFIDDVRVSGSVVSNFHNLIGYVPQDLFLFDGNIYENIASKINLTALEKSNAIVACKLACIHDEIISFSSGYDTEVGERGLKLSGGQRQRLAIARAVYKKPEILILDEATSALDENTEAKVMNNIVNINNGVTILMVAHRISTLKNCDRILEIS